MGKEEKILKKIGKLLKMYGADDEEAQKFIDDFVNSQDDDEDEEIIEEKEPLEEEKPTEIPVDEEEPKVEGEKLETEEPTAEEEPLPQEDADLPKEPVDEEMGGEEPTEIPAKEDVEETPADAVEQPLPPVADTEAQVPNGEVEQPTMPDYQALYEETQKALEGLSARFDALQEALSKAGVLVGGGVGVGIAQNDPSVESEGQNGLADILSRLNK